MGSKEVTVHYNHFAQGCALYLPDKIRVECRLLIYLFY